MGKFELADRGTLFLDELNMLPLDLQAKLLRALQENMVTRLGDTKPISIDVRVIGACNVDLQKEVENGNFREDLYYRLSVIEILIPPLRERREDISLLAIYSMDHLCRGKGFAKPKISREVVEAFDRYDWPGNVRELENCIERAVLLSNGETITKEHLPRRILEGFKKGSPQPVTQLSAVRDNMRDLMKHTLDACHGNVSLAARKLEISRSTLYRKMREYGLR